MKILIVLSCLQGGGAERVATIWANSFVSLGHEVVLATNKDITDAPFIYPIHEKVILSKCFGTYNISLTPNKRFIKRYVPLIYKTIKSVRQYTATHCRLRKAIISFKPDIILGVAQQTSFRALIAAVGSKSLVIATEHYGFERPSCYPLTLKQKFFKFIVNKWYKAVTILTEADRLYIGNRLKKVYVMPNPLSFTPINNHIDRKKCIVAAGRLDAWLCKGFDILIKAWGKIAYKYPEWTVDIAGNANVNETKTFLEKLIEENGVNGRCVLSGFHSDMKQYFSTSEIFVLSSRCEGFGMVLIEAMSQGCACIACDYKGRQREIIRNDDEGLCIPPDDVDILANAIEKMIVDEKYRRKIQQNAPIRAADYSPEIIAHKWEKLFNTIIEK